MVMRAYNMSMLLIFINAGFAILHQMNMFGNAVGKEIGERSQAWFINFSLLSDPIITVPGINLPITGILAIAITIAGGTIVVLNTNLITDRGISMVAFTVIFFGSIFIAGATIFANYDQWFPGIEIFYTIYVIACTLMYLVSIVQMSTGGMKAHV